MAARKKGTSKVEAETIAKLNEATDGVLGREPSSPAPVADPADVVVGHMLAIESIRLADDRDVEAQVSDPDEDSDPFGFRALTRHEGEAHLHLHALRAYLDAAHAAPPGEDDAVPEWDLLAQEDRDRLLKLYRRFAAALDDGEVEDLDPDGDEGAPDAATALAIYQSIVTGKVKIAQWKGRALVSATGGMVGSVLLTPNGYGARYGRKEREDDAPLDVCRVWVEAAASADGWKVLS